MQDVFDIVVVGSGAAGLMAAIRASSAARTLLVTDGPIGRSNSMMAQGGVQLPLPTQESREKFREDILLSARVPLDRALVDNFVNHVGDTMQQLEAWGLQLDRHPDGELVRRTAGGLSEPRIVSVADHIGTVLMRVLLTKLKECDVQTRTHTQVVDIESAADRLRLSLKQPDGGLEFINARAVVSCTGGLAYWEAARRGLPTTNPQNHNHVLYQALRQRGLERVHERFFQYQPFGIVDSPSAAAGRCIPESIVNFDVRLLDRHGKEICSVRQDRYTLTQRIFEVAARGDGVQTAAAVPGVWLTLGNVDPAVIERVFPKLYHLLVARDLLGRNVLVYPFLHYFLGGFRVNSRCETSLPGLFLAGEMIGGIHGRNRLMGNGITDSLVHGRIAGQSAAEFVRGRRG